MKRWIVVGLVAGVGSGVLWCTFGMASALAFGIPSVLIMGAALSA